MDQKYDNEGSLYLAKIIQNKNLDVTQMLLMNDISKIFIQKTQLYAPLVGSERGIITPTIRDCERLIPPDLPLPDLKSYALP